MEAEGDPAVILSAIQISLSAPGGGEGRGEVGDARAPVDTHLTLPIAARWVPSLSPLEGGEGKYAWPERGLCR